MSSDVEWDPNWKKPTNSCVCPIISLFMTFGLTENTPQLCEWMPLISIELKTEKINSERELDMKSNDRQN